MAKKRTVAVVTGTRAEFGLLATVMRAVDAHPGLVLRTVVAGSHLVTGTWRDVRDAGFGIDAKVRMQRGGETGRAADVVAVSRGVAGFGRAFNELKPDVVLVLGDRIEAFAAATAASIGGCVLAHVHGGDRAEGVADEAMRHAISKLAHVHFPATALSRKRLIRMGESPEMVYNVGSPALDALGEVELDANAPTMIVLQHPIGATDAQEEAWMLGTLDAVDRELGDPHERRFVWHVGPNLDPGRDGIVRAFERRLGPGEPAHAPRHEFVRALAGARVIVGNSSAGLIEAAVLRTPCVNIGPRQNGREKPGNVIDCDYGEKAVRAAIRKALALDLRRMKHPYGDGRTGERIAAVLAEIELGAGVVRKQNAY